MPSQEQVRSRGWVFTINNPTAHDNQCIEFLADDATYVIVGKEIGEGGTPHLQGYAWYKQPARFNRLKHLLPRAHLEKQRGNNQQAIDYCKKDNDFQEWGTPPENNNQKSKWSTIVKLAEDGNLEQLKSDHPRIYFQYLEKIKGLKIHRPSIIEGELQHEWWYGPTGTGKSMKLWNEYPDHYPKKKNKWWDGYIDQHVVAIEEWSPSFHMLASELKIWSDRYPFPAEIKGGTLPNIRPLKIIVISNYTIDQCFPIAQDAEPLKRRFRVTHFPSLFIPQPELTPLPINIDDIEYTLAL